MSDKKEFRSMAQNFRNSLSKADIVNYSDRIFVHLRETDEYKHADILLSYVEYKNEVITTDIIKQSLADGKTVAVPKVNGALMDFYKIKDILELCEGYKGIREPLNNSNNIFIPSNEYNILMLLPGLAYDHSFNRIGYGGGYYDRYLFKYRQNINILAGLAYEGQIFECIPAEPFDYIVDMIITEKNIYR